MKKWLYILAGLIVTIAGVWMGVHWWRIFWPFLLGVGISFVIMAGVIILIVGFMTPAKEETFELPDDNTDEDSSNEDDSCTQDCENCGETTDKTTT
jgi:cytoskeletal protein RodZ